MFLPSKPIDIMPSPEELIRFLGKVEVMDVPGTDVHGCWRWMGSINPESGYGQVRVRRKLYRTHRLAFACFVGPLEDNDDVHHRCRHKWCVNPRHLEALPHDEHGAESGYEGAANLIGVQFLGGPLDSTERKYYKTAIPEFFQIKSYGRVETYRYSDELHEFVYDGYRKLKRR